jgi:hypothetical protein
VKTACKSLDLGDNDKKRAGGKCPVTASNIEPGMAVQVTCNGKQYVRCCVAGKSVFAKAPQIYIQKAAAPEAGPANPVAPSHTPLLTVR